MKIVTFTILVLCFNTLLAQYTIRGNVSDENNNPIPGANIIIKNTDKGTISNEKGNFSISINNSNALAIEISFIGYKKQEVKYIPGQTGFMEIKLKSEHFSIEELKIVSNTAKEKTDARSLSVETINSDIIETSLSNNLIKSIESIPGINSIDIGSGFSKPVIRGLSFNRVLVAENAIKQNGQHWGADHGLEVDQFSISRVEVIKGPSSILYGSDAIGGVIHLNNEFLYDVNKFKVKNFTFTNSYNKSLGNSFEIFKGNGTFFIKSNVTLKTFADYMVPTDEVIYLTRSMPIDGSLKNTAGNEFNYSIISGIKKDRFKLMISIKNVNQKSGFFPGAHGVPDLSRLEDDGNDRNIDFPYQHVNHTKLISNSSWFNELQSFTLDFAYQRNHRQEWSLFHTHYSNQQAPETNPNLELDFNLHSLNGLATYKRKLSANSSLKIGVSNQYLKNDIAGYNFLLPAFKSYDAGILAYYSYKKADKFSFEAGLRFDNSKLSIAQYIDTTLETFLIKQNYPISDIQQYIIRSEAMDKTFNDISWSVGFSWLINTQLRIKSNIGKSFRTPHPIELAANGVHHGSFRHEKGNATLDSEVGYQSDFSFYYTNNKLSLHITPFASYFSNYIFLEPTGDWSILPHAGQMYQYNQSEVIRYGGEFEINYAITKELSFAVNGEHVISKQLSANKYQRYPLPFSPPPSVLARFDYNFTINHLHTHFYIEERYTTAQNNIARNELTTPGYQITNLGIRASSQSSKLKRLRFTMSINNLFNKKYWNHISFYRTINIPEPGRNISAGLLIELSK